jgi:GABA(A) receptor-associated protein
MFREKYTHQARLHDALYALEKHPDKIPIICEPISSAHPKINRNKYLVAQDLTVGQFIYSIRPRIIGLKPEQALFLFISNSGRGSNHDMIIPATSALIKNLYDQYKSTDGFLYIGYSLENTFG